MFESLRSLSDSQIITGSKVARAQEHSGMLAMIGFIVETERRQLFLRRGYSSLYNYCVRELGYSESQAMRRIIAARCIVRFPDVFERLKANEISLATISRVSKILSPENCGDVLNSIRRKSVREVEAIVAEHEPVAVFPPDRVRMIVAKVSVGRAHQVGDIYLRDEGKKDPTLEIPTMTDKREDAPSAALEQSVLSGRTNLPTQDHAAALNSSDNHDLSAQDQGSTLDSTDKQDQPAPGHSSTLHSIDKQHDPTTTASAPTKDASAGFSTSDSPPAPTSSIKLERRARVEFTARQELMEKLERIRALASHRLPARASMEQLIDFMADYVIHREDPVKRHQRRQARDLKKEQELG